MGKRCIICGNPAKYCIKNSSEFYCSECARENFSDLGLLQTVEERAKRLKEYVDSLINKADIKQN